MGLLPTYSPQPVNLRSLYFDAPAPAGIASRTPNLGERITDALHGMGMDQRQANRLGDKVYGALNALTPLGAIPEAQQAKTSYRAGNYGSALAHGVAAAVSAVPDGGMFAHGAGAVAHSIIAPLFHGSPHAFEKFALEKIGTGEGAQAYGHGLYFAENPDVAKQYQSTVSLQHAGVDWGNDPASAAAYWLGMGKNRGEAISMFQTMQKQHQAILDRAAKGLPVAPGAVANSQNEIAQSAAAIGHLKNGTERSGLGHLYEVQLDANPEDFLDWDAPAIQQPQRVHDFLSKREGGPDALLGRRGFNYVKSGTYGDVSAAIPNEEWLSAGIPGIRYLDQGSRNMLGNLTHNYVVFDPSIIDILNRH